MKLFAIAFASLFFAACAGAPKPPEGHACGINGQTGYLLCFDLAKDFDSDAKLKPEAKGERRPITLLDLHKGWFLDASSKESLQAYGMKWKQRYQQLQKTCN